MSKILIIPTDNIQRLCSSTEDFKFFFNRFPFEVIIELALSLEHHRDFSTALWGEIEQKLTEDEINLLVLENIDTVLEIVTEMFYEELRDFSEETDIAYEVLFWLPDAVCLMPDNFRLKLIDPNECIRNNYPASEF